MSWNYRGNCGSGMKCTVEEHKMPNQRKRIKRQPLPTEETFETISIKFNGAAIAGIAATWLGAPDAPFEFKIGLSILFIISALSVSYD